MQKLIAAFICIVALTGCASLYPIPATPICGQPEAAGSVICAVSAKIGTTPEQMNDMLLDVALLPIATKVSSANQLREAVTKVSVWVDVADINFLTINGIIAYLVSEAKIDPALALLLSRRLVFLQVPGLELKVLTPFDKSLVQKHLANQLEQLNFF